LGRVKNFMERGGVDHPLPVKCRQAGPELKDERTHIEPILPKNSSRRGGYNRFDRRS